MVLTKIGASLGGSADIINVTQTSHTFVSNDRGKAVRMNNNSGTPQYVLAIASATTTADAIGIIIHVTDGNNFTMATSGRITVDYCIPSGVAGTVVFLSHTAAGVLTSTEPSAAGHVSKPMAVITIAGSEMIMLQQRGEVISTGAVSIADGPIDNDAMADDAIDTDEIADDAVTADKLANSINTEIAANTAKTGITSGQTSAITANSAKVTNATHTGDVTGATALTIADGAVDIAMLSASNHDNARFLRGDNTWQAAGGGDLSFGGDTFGADKVIGSNDAYALSFETAGVVRMRIEGAAGSYHAAGAITMPTQPAFMAHEASNHTTVTGNGSPYTQPFTTQIFDQNGDFTESPGTTFTAPVTGRYLFTSSIRLYAISTDMTYGVISLVTTNRTWNVYTSAENTSVTAGFFIAGIADMDAGNTCYVVITLYGMTGNTASVAGSSSNSISFSGILVA